MRNKVAIKIRTKKIIDRISYEPKKHKQKFTKSLRAQLASKRVSNNPSKEDNEMMRFGSINVNGLYQEHHWAIEEVLKDKNLDVSYLFIDISK